MDDETILAVATGRKRLLSQVLKTLNGNLKSSSIAQHLLIRGPRGMGKSFFLKYLQINFKRKKEFKNAELILLPEEQNNINSPSDLIKLILNDLNGESAEETTTLWEEPEEVWQIELNKLRAYIKQKAASGDYALVVVLENLDEFLRNIQHDKKTSKVYESRFRHLLENIKHLTIIGATPSIDADSIDGNYNNRLFHAFKKCNLTRWGEEEYFDYFERRKKTLEKESGIAFTLEQSILMRAKLKALSLYTGGSPRMAVVLTNLLLKEDVISTANTLLGLIDDLTPYYQDLTKSIPPKSKIIFDTLIRKGENLSQSEVAKIVGATQGKIAKAFQWLKDNGYITGKKRSDSPAFSYKVIDRIHVLYYQLREIHHNQNMTPIWLLSDFLVIFYREHELRKHAHQSLLEQPSRNANDLARVYLMSAGFLNKDDVPEWETTEEWLKAIENIPEENERINELLGEIEGYSKRENEEEFFEEFKGKVEELFLLFDGIENQKILSKYLQDGEDLIPVFSFESKDICQSCVFFLKNLLPFRLKEGDSAKIARTEGNVGLFLYGLERYEEAIEYHKKAISLIKGKQRKMEAGNLMAIGVNLEGLKSYKLAVEHHQKVLELDAFSEVKLKSLNLEYLGYNLTKLKRHEEAMGYYKQALKLREEETNVLEQARNLLCIGLNLKGLRQYKKAVEFHQKSLNLLNKKNRDTKIENNNYAEIISNYIVLNQWGEVDKLLPNSPVSNGIVFGKIAEGVKIIEENEGIAKAFETGNHLLRALKEKYNEKNIETISRILFATWLGIFKVSPSLLKDLVEEFLVLYPRKKDELYFNLMLHIISYLEPNKYPGYLEKLNPDEAIAIQDFVKELNLLNQ